MSHQIMLSVSRSLLKHAEQLQAYLAEKGYTVFLPNEIHAGMEYRNAVSEKALKCLIFIPFMNYEWCHSGECMYEFNIALPESLQSTSQTPYIIPILLEEHSYYKNFPGLHGFLKNSVGIVAKESELGFDLWKKIQHNISVNRKISPISPPHKSSVKALATMYDSPSVRRSTSASSTKRNSSTPLSLSNTTKIAQSKKVIEGTEKPVNVTVTFTSTTPDEAAKTTNRIPSTVDQRPHTTHPATTVEQHKPNIPNLQNIPQGGVQPTNSTSPNTLGVATHSPNPTTRPRRNSNVHPFILRLPQPLPADLDALVETSLQLIDDICELQVNGTELLIRELQEQAQPRLEDVMPTPAGETILRALMDYLFKIKEILTTSETIADQHLNEMAEKVYKLVHMWEHPDENTFLVGDFIAQPETRQFWEQHFGKKMYTVTLQQFFRALLADPDYTFIAEDDETVLDDLILHLDHNKLGYVVCHSLAEFVQDSTLVDTLRRYKQYTIQAIPSTKLSLTDENLPILIWVDDHPENNEDLARYAEGQGIHVVKLHDTSEAKQFIVSNSLLLEKNSQKIRFITDNVRSGAGTMLDMNAGEDLARYIQGRRIRSPILVYCGNTQFAQYASKYKLCKATNLVSDCQQFIDEFAAVQN